MAPHSHLWVDTMPAAIWLWDPLFGTVLRHSCYIFIDLWKEVSGDTAFRSPPERGGGRSRSSILLGAWLVMTPAIAEASDWWQNLGPGWRMIPFSVFHWRHFVPAQFPSGVLCEIKGFVFPYPGFFLPSSSEFLCAGCLGKRGPTEEEKRLGDVYIAT